MTDKIVPLKKYPDPEEVKHVFHSGDENQGVYKCPTCGTLPVIGGVVIHGIKMEKHDMGEYTDVKPILNQPRPDD